MLESETGRKASPHPRRGDRNRARGHDRRRGSRRERRRGGGRGGGACDGTAGIEGARGVGCGGAGDNRGCPTARVQYGSCPPVWRARTLSQWRRQTCNRLVHASDQAGRACFGPSVQNGASAARRKTRRVDKGAELDRDLSSVRRNDAIQSGGRRSGRYCWRAG
ncbi:MAG: hypothetical protein E6I03_10210 [Chloroflexi bacterium]|nr:MAG: hypothetical protein E6I03_10210 [Chloroflexota bacterium]